MRVNFSGKPLASAGTVSEKVDRTLEGRVARAGYEGFFPQGIAQLIGR